MKSFFYLYTISLVLMACSNNASTNLERVLDLSGENRAELEKVLTHYAQAPSDSLKLRAAKFLIENMSRHHYFEFGPDQEWEEILELSDSLIKKKETEYERIMREFYYMKHSSSALKFSYQKDMERITARDLIENIDAAFEVWPRPWNWHINFEDFCNFILPYRIKNEPLELTLRKEYKEKNLKKMNDTISFEEVFAMVKDLSSLPSDYRFIKLSQFDQSISDIEKGRMADCIDFSNYAGFQARAIGIPVVVDFTLWPNSKGAHYWNSVVFSKDSLLYSDKDFFFGRPGSYELRRKIAKIYRLMYSEQIKDYKTLNNGTFLDNPHIVDITAQYIKTTDVHIDLRKIEGKTFANAYLCIFHNREWTPIAVSKLDKDHKIMFKDVGRENIFIISYLDDNKLIAASPAFSIDKKGNMQTHIADSLKLRKMYLTRKTKLTGRVLGFGETMKGGVFQLSEDPEFRSPKEVYRIPETDTILLPKKIEFKTMKPYRYARFKSDAGKPVEIAEMKWYSGENEFHGTLIGSNAKDYLKEGEKAIDDDNLTYFSSNSLKDSVSWIGVDFSKSQHLTAFEFSPRSDLNYVKPGDTYELLYWQDKWVSLGIILSKSYEIVYNNVPANSLLWLRNLTAGVEEELFIYEDGKQLFWNSSDL